MNRTMLIQQIQKGLACAVTYGLLLAATGVSLLADDLPGNMPPSLRRDASPSWSLVDPGDSQFDLRRLPLDTDRPVRLWTDRPFREERREPSIPVRDATLLDDVPEQRVLERALDQISSEVGDDRLTTEVLAAAAQAENLVSHGWSLARRGALYTARAEFVGALGLIAQAMDDESYSTRHIESLAAGFHALEEAQDFIIHGSQLAANMDMTRVVAGHSTTALKNRSLDGITPIGAQQRYGQFARRELAAAVGQLPVSSRALYGLGRLTLAMDATTTRVRITKAPMAMALYQAALDVDLNNHLAANELGVLLAQFGKHPEAVAALRHSLTLLPQAQAWHNLSEVHRREGQWQLAALAQRECQRTSGGLPLNKGSPQIPVQWVSAAEFARSTPLLAGPEEMPAFVHPPTAAAVPVNPRRTIEKTARPGTGALWWGPATLNGDSESRGSGAMQQVSNPMIQGRAVGSVAADGGVKYAGSHHGLASRRDLGLLGHRSRMAPNVYPTGIIIDDMYGPGEYVGPARMQHVPEYRLRVDDRLDFVYRLTREETAEAYQMNVGDVIVVEAFGEPAFDRGALPQGQGLLIQPDGTISLHLLGQVQAARRTVEELRQELTVRYRQFIIDPQITVTPLKVNTKLEDLRATVDNRYGAGGQTSQARVTPEGTVQLPAVGSVPAQGLTLDELKQEIDERYDGIVAGIEVTPILAERAPRHVYVVGEVRTPGRFIMEGPTTVMQSIALAGGWNQGANLHQVIVFRRTGDWQLIATRMDLWSALHGHSTCPADEIWLRDTDLVLVPKSSVQLGNDVIDMIFTRGLWSVLPISIGVNLVEGSLL